MDRFPIILYIGGGVVAWTAAKMIVQEPFLKAYFTNPFLQWGFEILVTGVVLLSGVLTNQKRKIKEKG
ncbi:hypothetical protein [Sporomusa sp.]|uniref:hypothetical protein n=1 Tax=Sporomusa sp. TaxID=2078658 RepID=UPI002BD902FD|nr:hypothetical protein [Sporomusa sp.]HWR07081.1 hypothetical protein [Sporomusa sp.]